MKAKIKTLLLHLPVNLTDIHDYDNIIQPYGLAVISGFLKSHGCDITLFDAHAYHNEKDQIIQFIKELNPTILGLPVYTSQLPQTIYFLKDLKRVMPDIITVVGGPHPTAESESLLLQNKEIDIAIRNEGEFTMLEIINRLQNNTPLNDVAGITYRVDGEVKVNSCREFIKDINSLPFADWDSLPMERYWGANTERKNFANIVFSRGCPFSCTFCGAKEAIGRKHRRRSPESISEEVKLLYEKYGVRELGLSDSTFNVNKKWVKEVCEALLDLNKPDLVWQCNIRADLIDQESLVLMKKSGCTKVFVGVESGDDEMLKSMKKGTNCEMIRKCVNLLDKMGFQVFCGFLIGMPGETKASIQKTMALAKELRKHSCAFSIATPFPGSEFYEIAKQEGFVVEDWSKYDTYSLSYVTKGLTGKDLQYYYDQIVKNNYLSYTFISNQLRQIRTWLQFKVQLRIAMRIIFGRRKTLKKALHAQRESFWQASPT